MRNPRPVPNALVELLSAVLSGDVRPGEMNPEEASALALALLTPEVPREPVDITEAARRTLERALGEGAWRIDGGPWCVTPTSKHRTWRFDPSTLRAWWRAWNAERLPAKPEDPSHPNRRRSPTKRREGSTATKRRDPYATILKGE